jgi:hypothetical protein
MSSKLKREIMVNGMQIIIGNQKCRKNYDYFLKCMIGKHELMIESEIIIVDY